MADADPVGTNGVALHLAREKYRPDTLVRSGLTHRGQARSYKGMQTYERAICRADGQKQCV
jgi:hypothetical protein